MKLLMIDIDTLRPDHLGCYGYERNTSPNIDSIARDGVCFGDYYCSDAPCLPSRAALFSGHFGFHTGVIAHGGKRADPYPDGESRNFRDRFSTQNLPAIMRDFGMYTASVSTFAERHSAWWFYAGFQEMHNVGKGGGERADEVTPVALDWLKRSKSRKDWFLHVHYWDPHTNYRTPSSIGNPFAGQPSSSIDWIDEDVLAGHRKAVGFHSANEVMMFTDQVPEDCRERQPGKIESLSDVRKNVDGYDCGVYYADLGIGEIVNCLKEMGIYEETAIIVTSDHGEDLGELCRYSEHGVADYQVTRIPLIVKWPGGMTGGKVLGGLHYNIDLLPTLIGLMDPVDMHSPYDDILQKMYGDNYKEIYLKGLVGSYDGKGFSDAVLKGSEDGRENLVVSCATHSIQRAVRFGDYLYIRTYHDGYCLFPEEMLFDIRKDPHEQRNLAGELPDKVWEGAHILAEWTDEQMKANAERGLSDPLWEVMGEGAAYHVKGALPAYLKRLEETGRKEQADTLRKKYPKDAAGGLKAGF